MDLKTIEDFLLDIGFDVYDLDKRMYTIKLDNYHTTGDILYYAIQSLTTKRNGETTVGVEYSATTQKDNGYEYHIRLDNILIDDNFKSLHRHIAKNAGTARVIRETQLKKILHGE